MAIDKIKKINKYNFPDNLDLIHLSCGPNAMKINNGARKGIINF